MAFNKKVRRKNYFSLQNGVNFVGTLNKRCTYIYICLICLVVQTKYTIYFMEQRKNIVFTFLFASHVHSLSSICSPMIFLRRIFY